MILRSRKIIAQSRDLVFFRTDQHHTKEWDKTQSASPHQLRRERHNAAPDASPGVSHSTESRAKGRKAIENHSQTGKTLSLTPPISQSGTALSIGRNYTIPLNP